MDDVARGAVTSARLGTPVLHPDGERPVRGASVPEEAAGARTENRDKAISVPSFRAHLKAIHGWAVQQPTDLSAIQQAVFVANGDHDRMVPSHNSADLARRVPNAHLRIYPDAGHGGIFQYHTEFVPEALAFLDA